MPVIRLRPGLAPGGEVIADFTFMLVLVSITATALMIPAVRLPAVASFYRSVFVTASAPDASAAPQGGG